MSGPDLADMPSEVASRRPWQGKKKESAAPHDQIRSRIRVTFAVFALAYLVIAGRLVMFGLEDPVDGNAYDANAAIAASRPDILDRNGEILATDIRRASVYAEPRNIDDADDAAEQISSVLTDLDTGALRKRLSGDAGFVWIKREITPKQEAEIHGLGLPGVGFLRENRRYYPGGPTAAHILGVVNVDNQGIAGIEKTIDDKWLADLHAAGFARGEDLDPVPSSATSWPRASCATTRSLPPASFSTCIPAR
jgi:cell division protein FtsI (penicillin-binding protein 3)